MPVRVYTYITLFEIFIYLLPYVASPLTNHHYHHHHELHGNQFFSFFFSLYESEKERFWAEPVQCNFMIYAS